MGEQADMLINGFLDYETGEFLGGESPGYPRTNSRGHNKKSDFNSRRLKGRRPPSKSAGLKLFIRKGIKPQITKGQLRYISLRLAQDIEPSLPDSASWEKVVEVCQRDWQVFKNHFYPKVKMYYDQSLEILK